MQSLPSPDVIDWKHDFRKPKLPLTKWFLAMHLLSQTKTGLSAMEPKAPVGRQI